MLRFGVAALALYVSLALIDGACESGYTPTEIGSCVQLRTGPKTWDDARTDCQASGGDLVKILDETTNWLINYLITQNKGFYWTGLRHHNAESKFQWLDDNAEVTYFNWAYITPWDEDDSTTGENCVGMGLTRNSTWSGLNCESGMSYICEKSA